MNVDFPPKNLFYFHISFLLLLSVLLEKILCIDYPRTKVLDYILSRLIRNCRQILHTSEPLSTQLWPDYLKWWMMRNFLYTKYACLNDNIVFLRLIVYYPFFLHLQGPLKQLSQWKHSCFTWKIKQAFEFVSTIILSKLH